MTPPARRLPAWQAAVLRALVLVGGLFALGGVLTLFALGLLANGRGIGALNFSWVLFGLSLAAGLAQGWLTLLGWQTAWRWIAVVAEPAPSDTRPGTSFEPSGAEGAEPR